VIQGQPSPDRQQDGRDSVLRTDDGLHLTRFDVQIEAFEEPLHPDPLGVQGLGVIRCGPGGQLFLVGDPFSLDVEAG